MERFTALSWQALAGLGKDDGQPRYASHGLDGAPQHQDKTSTSSRRMCSVHSIKSLPTHTTRCA